MRLTLTASCATGAWVAELTDTVDLAAWPTATRLVCRRERPHSGAQLSFSDHDGHRFQCFITDQTDNDLALLEARHRQHAVVENRIRCLKAMGLSNLPFSGCEPNATWLEVALIAHDLTVWTQQTCLCGAHAIAEPKRLRYRILHVAARLTRHARRTTPHLQGDWPCAAALLAAFKRLDTARIRLTPRLALTAPRQQARRTPATPAALTPARRPSSRRPPAIAARAFDCKSAAQTRRHRRSPHQNARPTTNHP